MTCCSAISVPARDEIKQKIDHDRLLSLSHELADGMMQTDFVVPSMHCIACIRKIEDGIARLPSVHTVRANLSTRRVRVKWLPDAQSSIDFIAEFADLGFEATFFDMADMGTAAGDTGRQLLLCLAVAGFAAANVMLLSVSVWSGASAETARLFQLISGLIAVPACLFSGRPFFSSALRALKAKSINMDVPISLAVLLALGMSVYDSLSGQHETYFDASVTLLFFLLLGRYLDHMMRERARSAVMQLAKLVPSGAVLVAADGAHAYTPVSELTEGNVILVAAGERIPVDCIVIDGFSDLDRSLVTGESTSIKAEPDLEIEAGVLNLSGPLMCRVLRPAKSSFVAEVVAMMEAAEQSKSGHVRIADRAARIYAPAVHILAGLSFIAWMIITSGDWHVSIYVTIAVLIITCPCALGLAVPIAHVVAANRLFRSGVMLKDGAALEKLAEVDMVVFDKTGTLTLGEPRVTSIDGGTEHEHALAVMLARLSTHPAARAIARLQENPSGLLICDVEEIPGFGIEAVWQGKKVRLGRRSWVSEIVKTSKSEEAVGSEVCFARQGASLVCFAMADTLRADAVVTVNSLKSLRFDVEIISGDSEGAVGQVACLLGIERASANLKPADKIARIGSLQQEGRKVLFVGDGLNDAPALAAAHVSMAPASASDIGRACAGLVFTTKGLAAITTSLKVARQTGRVVKQNFALAIGYNCIAVPFAIMGYVTPLFAAIAMSTSSIAVVANSLRLNFIATDQLPRDPHKHAMKSPPVNDGKPKPRRLELVS